MPGREKAARSPCEEPPRTSSDSGAWHRKSCARAHACEVHTCRRPSVGLGPRDRAPDHATRRLPCRAHAGGRAYRVLALAACVIALSLHNLGEQHARYILFFYWHTAVQIAEIFCDVSWKCVPFVIKHPILHQFCTINQVKKATPREFLKRVLKCPQQRPSVH